MEARNVRRFRSQERRRQAKVPGKALGEGIRTNIAKALRLEKTKGQIKENFDADILMLNNQNQIDTFISRGKVMMDDSKLIVQFPFE